MAAGVDGWVDGIQTQLMFLLMRILFIFVCVISESFFDLVVCFFFALQASHV